MPLPDPAQSRAVLVGTAKYARESGLGNLEPVSNNLTELRRLLCDSTVCGLPAQNCLVVRDPRAPIDVARVVGHAADEAQDTLFVYYAGHGLLDDDGSLHLGLSQSTRDYTRFDSFAYDALRSILARSSARKRILILDCCFSGKAVSTMAPSAVDTATGQLDVSGTYILTATPATKAALAPQGANFTAFTEQLVSVLRGGVPGGPETLSMGLIYSQLNQALRARALPAPQQRVTNTAINLELARNQAWRARSWPGAEQGDVGAGTLTDAGRRIRSHTRSSVVRPGVRPRAVNNGQAREVLRVRHNPLGGLRTAAGRFVSSDTGSPGALFGVDFSEDGLLLATAGNDGTAHVWDAESGDHQSVVRHRRPVHTVVFSPDTRRIATTSRDGSARIWNTSSGRELLRVRHDGIMSRVRFSPDGTKLATTGEDGTARLWDADSGKELKRFEHGGKAYGVAFSGDGTRLATSSADGVRVWEINGREVMHAQVGLTVADVVFTHDGERIGAASTDLTIRIWDVATATEIDRIDHDALVLRLAFSPDSALLATGDLDGFARVWRLGEKGEFSHMKHDGKVVGVVFSPNGTRVATASHDKTARVWEVVDYDIDGGDAVVT